MEEKEDMDTHINDGEDYDPAESMYGDESAIDDSGYHGYGYLSVAILAIIFIFEYLSI